MAVLIFDATLHSLFDALDQAIFRHYTARQILIFFCMFVSIKAI